MRTFVFILTLTVANGVYLAWAWLDCRRRRRQVYRRLEIIRPAKADPRHAALLRTEPGGGPAAAGRWFRRMRVGAAIEARLEQAGRRGGLCAFLRQEAMFAAACGSGAALLFPLEPAAGFALGAVAGALLPIALLARAAAARMERFEEQFPACLEFISRSMRAGHGFSVALELIPAEFEDPLAAEFRRAFEEHSLGMPLDAALRKLGARVPLLPVQFFVCAVSLQKRTGGNLAEVLDKLAGLIRERFKLKQRIKVISAHGKMTATALTLIPACVAGLMWIANPRYMSFFVKEGSGGAGLALAAIAMQAIGYGVIRRMVRIEA